MASRAFTDAAASAKETTRLYTLCVFGSDFAVPWATLLDAESDDDAIAMARSMNRFSERELWDGHRLVAVIPPA